MACESNLPADTRKRSDWRRVALVALLTGGGLLLLHVVERTFLAGTTPFWRRATPSFVDIVIVGALVLLYLQLREYARATSQAHQSLLASERLRKDLTSMLVHDMKGPVSVSANSLQIVRARPDIECLRDGDVRLLDASIQSLHRLEAMIGDLLTIYQAEEGEVSLAIAPVDLAGIAAECAEEYTPLAHEQGVRIVTSGTPAVARADACQIRRVVENLLANAIKFAPAGGVVEVGTAVVDDASVEVFVRDSGPGIRPEDRERIFDKFGQLEARRSLGVSVGLGLAFCRHVVDAHGGRVWVEEAPGGGSLFRVQLPAARQ